MKASIASVSALEPAAAPALAPHATVPIAYQILARKAAPAHYRGARSSEDEVRVHCTKPGQPEARLPLAREVADHADRFEWGYPGAAPRQLAVALLAHAAGAEAARDEQIVERLLAVVTALPRQKAARGPRGGKRWRTNWRLTREDVLAIAGLTGGTPAAPSRGPARAARREGALAAAPARPTEARLHYVRQGARRGRVA